MADPTTLILPTNTGRGRDAYFAIAHAQQAVAALLAGELDAAAALLTDLEDLAKRAGADQVDGDDRLDAGLVAATKEVAARALDLLGNLRTAQASLAAAAELAATPAPLPADPPTGG